MRPDQGQELREVISTCFCSFLYILYYSQRCRLRFIWHSRMPGSPKRPVAACLACAGSLGRTSGPLNGIAGERPRHTQGMPLRVHAGDVTVYLRPAVLRRASRSSLLPHLWQPVPAHSSPSASPRNLLLRLLLLARSLLARCESGVRREFWRKRALSPGPCCDHLALLDQLPLLALSRYLPGLALSNRGFRQDRLVEPHLPAQASRSYRAACMPVLFREYQNQ